VWKPEELKKAAEIAERHGLAVISDEIHSEIVCPGYKYTPFGNISKGRYVTICSSSKSFNTAGLQFANIVSPDPEIRAKVNKVLNINEVCDVNPFGIESLLAAYTPEGEEWLDEMNAYVRGNYEMLREAFAKELPEFPVVKLEGTYLAWIDCKALTRRAVNPVADTDIEKELYAHEAVWVNNGRMYGDSDFLRVNMATQHSTFEVGVKRMVHGLKRLLAK
jgi:cystathionine beta-lyase